MIHYFKEYVFNGTKYQHERKKMEEMINELKNKIGELEDKIGELKHEVEVWEREYERVELEVDRKTILGMRHLQEKNEKDWKIFRLKEVLAEAERNLKLFTNYRNFNPF